MRKRQLRPTPTSTLTRKRSGNTQLAQRRSDSNADADADADADAKLGGNGLYVGPYPLVGGYEDFEIGRFSKGATIRILWGPGVF